MEKRVKWKTLSPMIHSQGPGFLHFKRHVSADKWLLSVSSKVFPFSKDAPLHSLKRSEPSTCGQAYPLIWRRIYPIFPSLLFSTFLFFFYFLFLFCHFSFLQNYEPLKWSIKFGGGCFSRIDGRHGST